LNHLPAAATFIQRAGLVRTGWTFFVVVGTLSSMPLRLSKVLRIGDYGARWWLCLRCRCCRHVGEIPAQVFVERYGVRATRHGGQ
jgi:hypothetical protein